MNYVITQISKWQNVGSWLCTVHSA